MRTAAAAVRLADGDPRRRDRRAAPVLAGTAPVFHVNLVEALLVDGSPAHARRGTRRQRASSGCSR